MSNAREKIISNIRNSLQRKELPCAEQDFLMQRMLHPQREILPTIANDLIKTFIEKAENTQAKVTQISSISALPREIAAIFKNKTKSSLCIADIQKFKNLTWDNFIEIKTGLPTANDYASLTEAFCGVAETGTIVQLSSKESPTTLNFLPEVHIVVLNTTQIVAFYEDAWDILRAENNLPRVVNFITGPSRTGDIEQTIQIGIHGPKELHIILLKELS